jgi:hypothetical protein
MQKVKEKIFRASLDNMKGSFADPDPLVRGKDPDPDPSIIKQNGLFIFENLCKCTFKIVIANKTF